MFFENMVKYRLMSGIIIWTATVHLEITQSDECVLKMDNWGNEGYLRGFNKFTIGMGFHYFI